MYGSLPATGFTHKISICNRNGKKNCLNSSLPNAAYLCQWIGSALVQIMACCLFGTKPLSKLMLGYCQLDALGQISIKIQNFSFMKMHLKLSSAKWRPFCPGRNELVPDCHIKANIGTHVSWEVGCKPKVQFGWEQINIVIKQDLEVRIQWNVSDYSSGIQLSSATQTVILYCNFLRPWVNAALLGQDGISNTGHNMKNIFERLSKCQQNCDWKSLFLIWYKQL